MSSDTCDRLNLALLASHEGVWDWKVGEDDIYYSDRAFELIGESKSHAPNFILKAEELLHPEDYPDFEKSLQNALADNGEDMLAADARYHHPDGSWRWFRIRGVVERNDRGEATRVVGTLIDISHRKIAELELKEERHRLKQLVESIPVNVYYKDKESRFVLANSSTAHKLGVDSVEELLGKTDHDFFDATHADHARANELKIMETKVPQLCNIECETWEGKEDTWAEVSKLPWLDHNGNVRGTFGITNDITKTMKAQEELKKLADELQTRNQLIEEELQLAREIQQALIPKSLETKVLKFGHKTITFSSRYDPASEMAGDFLEIIHLSDDSLGVLICDVMGHGVRSSLIVSMIRGLMEKERKSATHPEQFLKGINEGLVSILKRANVTLFATAIYCVIDAQKGTLEYSCAGHPAPIILKDGVARQLEHLHHQSGANKPDPAIGLFPHVDYKTEVLSLNKIDRMLLFTDGLFEVENDDGEYLEMEKIISMMEKTANLDQDMSLGFLIAQARLHSRYGLFDDDVCLFAMDISENPIGRCS